MKKLFLILKNKAKNFDIFDLGNSFVLWYILIFTVLPAAVYLNSPFVFVAGYKKNNFSFDFRTIFYLIAGLVAFVVGYYFYFLRFYQKNKILESEEKTKQFRLMLTQAVGKVIKEGLYLLGIKTVEKM